MEGTSLKYSQQMDGNVTIDFTNIRCEDLDWTQVPQPHRLM
jgi:hypothetical protein